MAVPIRQFIDVTWGSPVADKLLSAVARMGDYEVLLRTIGRKVVLSQRKNILEQRTPEGSRWPGLKNPRGPGHNPGSIALFDTGALFDDIQFQLIGDDAVEIGHSADTFYGRFQNLGTSTIPARRFIGLRDDDLPEILADTSEHVEQAFAQEAGR